MAKVLVKNKTRRPIPVASGIEVPALGTLPVDAALAESLRPYENKGACIITPIPEADSAPRSRKEK